MFCPTCRTEYRPGFDQCADCRVPLVERLPPHPEPPVPTGEEKRWELNRTDSLGIAFVQGALIGYATALMLVTTAHFVIRQLYFNPGPNGITTPDWLMPLQSLLSMLPPMGIVIGGYVARSRRLR